MDVACSSEMLVSDDKDITLSPQHRTSNVYSELTLVNKLINLSCEFSYVKIGKIYKWIMSVNKFFQNHYSNKICLIIAPFPVEDVI
jgi:hypothetical protein